MSHNACRTLHVASQVLREKRVSLRSRYMLRHLSKLGLGLGLSQVQVKVKVRVRLKVEGWVRVEGYV